MKNPWLALPSRPPFLLPSDAPYIAAFNRTASASRRVDTTLLPVPFMGDPTAPVVILALNPGVKPGDHLSNRQPASMRRARSNLAHLLAARPFSPLDGDPTRPGARWWRRNLKEVLAAVGEDRAARSLFCLEFFPYHSRDFGHAAVRLPSQDYAFLLLRRAIDRGAVIVATRGMKMWTGAVPELATYSKLIVTRNVRSASISPRNCGSGFATVVRQLQGAAT